MNHWTRLTDESGTKFERLLLDSAQIDRVPPASRQHVAARLGIDLARIDASAALVRSTPASESASLAKAGLEPASAAALVKCTLIAVIGGLSAVSTTSQVEAVSAPIMTEVRTAASVPAPAPTAVMSERTTAPQAATSDESVRPGEPLAPTLVRRARKPAAAAKVEPAGVHSENATDPLLLEVEQLDRVRAALGTGRTVDALHAIDEYEARFPRGALRLEASVLRIRTLERAGRFANAARLARSVLELSGSERYRSELVRVANGEGTRGDKGERGSTLEESR